MADHEASSIAFVVKKVIDLRTPIETLVELLEDKARSAASQVLPPEVIDERVGQRTPLQTAVDVGRLDIAMLLLGHGASLDAQDLSDGKTSLHLACDGLTPEHALCALHLVRQGANVNLVDKGGWTALHACCKRGRSHAVIVEALLGSGADPNLATTVPKRTSLHYAAASGSLSIVSLLVFFGAELEATDRSLMTPLHCAVANGHERTALLLLHLGASTGARDFRGWTPAQLAKRHSNHALAVALTSASRLPWLGLIELISRGRARVRDTPYEPPERTAPRLFPKEFLEALDTPRGGAPAVVELHDDDEPSKSRSRGGGGWSKPAWATSSETTGETEPPDDTAIELKPMRSESAAATPTVGLEDVEAMADAAARIPVAKTHIIPNHSVATLVQGVALRLPSRAWRAVLSCL
jgi:hypothetical protein